MSCTTSDWSRGGVLYHQHQQCLVPQQISGAGKGGLITSSSNGLYHEVGKKELEMYQQQQQQQWLVVS